MIMVPLRNQGSAFAKFCVSSQDAAEKVNLLTLRFAAALCQTPLIDTDGKHYTEWLADGMGSVQSHWNGRTPSGLYGFTSSRSKSFSLGSCGPAWRPAGASF